MITKWLIAVVIFFARLAIPPGYWPSNEVPHIDPRARCPACGGRDGRIITKKLPNNELVIQHDCNICKAVWHEKPIVKGRNVIHAAPAKPESAKADPPAATPIAR